jgi:hypothetical protein
MPAPIEHSSARNRFPKNQTRKFFCGRVRESLALSRFAVVDSPHVIRFWPLGVSEGGFCVPQSGSVPGRWGQKWSFEPNASKMGSTAKMTGRKVPKSVYFGKTGHPTAAGPIVGRTGEYRDFFIVTN